MMLNVLLTLLQGCFSRFLNCTNGTNGIMQRITYMLNYNITRSGSDSLKELRNMLTYIKATRRDIRKKKQRIKLKYE